MIKFKRIVLPLLIGLLITIISLVSLLIPFYYEENRLKENAFNLNENISLNILNINEDNYTSYISFITNNFKNYELMVFSLNDNTFSTSLKNDYSKEDLLSFSFKENKIITIYDSNILNYEGFAYISLNKNTNLYLLTIVSISDIYLILKTLVILIPIFILSITYFKYNFNFMDINL